MEKVQAGAMSSRSMYQAPCSEPAACSSPKLMCCLISILVAVVALPLVPSHALCLSWPPQSRDVTAFPTKQLRMTRACFFQAGIIDPLPAEGHAPGIQAVQHGSAAFLCHWLWRVFLPLRKLFCSFSKALVACCPPNTQPAVGEQSWQQG